MRYLFGLFASVNLTDIIDIRAVRVLIFILFRNRGFLFIFFCLLWKCINQSCIYGGGGAKEGNCPNSKFQEASDFSCDFYRKKIEQKKNKNQFTSRTKVGHQQFDHQNQGRVYKKNMYPGRKNLHCLKKYAIGMNHNFLV